MNKNKKVVKNSPVVIGTFSGKCCDAEVVNNNEMHLSRELFETLFASDEYKRAMENRHYIGFLGHPEDPNCMDFKDACIVMTDCRIEPNGEITGDFDLIDTPVGRTVKSFIDAGVNFGISIRGAGDVDSDGEVDPETFVFRGFDLVTFPAYDDCIPTFQEVAASNDIEKQKKLKKVQAALNTNLEKITSASAIKVLQEQFNPKSKEYVKLEARKKAIECATEDDVSVEVLKQKLEGMTNLYMQQVKANKQLSKDIVAAQMSVYQANKDKQRFIKAAKAKYNAQLVNMQDQVDDALADLDEESEKREEAVNAATNLRKKVRALTEEINQLKGTNLKYKQKIESSTNCIYDKNSEIADLKNELDKTVVKASTDLQKKTSNLDATITELKQQIAASEEIIFGYQQAYANMYANALGTTLHNLSITSTTSVEDLQKVILASASIPNDHRLDLDDEFEGNDGIELIDDDLQDDSAIISM